MFPPRCLRLQCYINTGQGTHLFLGTEIYQRPQIFLGTFRFFNKNMNFFSEKTILHKKLKTEYTLIIMRYKVVL